MLGPSKLVSAVLLLAATSSTSSLFAHAAAVVGPANSPEAAQSANIIDGTFIVEFADHAVPAIFNAGNLVASIEATLRRVLNIAGVTVTVPLDYKMFKGAAIAIDDTEHANALASELAGHESVKNVWPRRIYYRTDPTLEGYHDYAPQGPYLEPGAGNPDYEVPTKIVYGETFAPHIMTQVDKLHAKGIYGNGSRISLVDTGVDYTLKALGSGFGTGYLISYGYDLVGDDFNGGLPPVPDPDPRDKCQGHGSHTAGIVAAQPGNDMGILGAAPGAQIGMYRVFGCTGATSDEALIGAFMMAYEDGSDVITASISGPSNWGDNAWTIAVERIVAAGVPCTLSASNGGQEGIFVPSGADDGVGVASISSFDNEYEVSLDYHTNYTVDGGPPQDFGWAPGLFYAWAGVKLPLYAPSLNASSVEAAVCYPLPDDTPDLSGKIVLLRSALCDPSIAAGHVGDKGGHYIIFYEQTRLAAHGEYTGSLSNITATATVSAAYAVEWLKAMAAGSTIVVTMDDPNKLKRILKYRQNPITGGFASFFTQWNPTYELEIKPSFGAPGGSILSTWMSPYYFYVASGTSMSCPLVAAIYALVGQVRGTYHPATIHTLLGSTANPQLYNSAILYSDPDPIHPYLAPVCQQGNGMVRAYDAAYATALLSTNSIAFNDTDNLIPTANFTIKNLDNQNPVTFKLGHVGAATAYTFSKGAKKPDAFPDLETTTDYATITFTGDNIQNSEITIPAGGEEMVCFTITPPTGLDGSRIPVYSGYITLNSTSTTYSTGPDSNSDDDKALNNLAVAYQGVAGSMKTINVIGDAWLSDTTDLLGQPVPGNQTYILTPKGSMNVATNPVAFVDLAFGTRFLDVHLVDITNSSSSSTGSDPTGQTGGKNLGSIYTAPTRNVDRNRPFYAAFNGTLADGNMAPPGRYVFEFSALRVFEDLKDTSKFQRLRSDTFWIEYTSS